MRGKSQLAISVCILLLGSAAIHADQTITIIPAKIVLSGPEAMHRLLVQRVEDGRIVGLPNGPVAWKSDNKIVAIENGVAVPKGNGKTRVTATIGKLSASCEVEVLQIDTPHQWSFRNHVQAVIAKSGCNSGSCHGALAGKGGLKLSLRGYDTNRDHHTITRQARGRRIELSDPGRSLILAKPSGGIAHKGGVRFDVGSRNYRVISEWIAAGAPGPSDTDPRVDRLEVLPALSVLQPGDEQQVLVRAHYSDGRIEDVTEWAKLTSTNETIAKIDQTGRVS
ncbi:MAG: S-layer protein, partial [Planctomycetota bacterium]|nr:S-layer protein [Planctomycetota bacterium]